MYLKLPEPSEDQSVLNAFTDSELWPGSSVCLVFLCPSVASYLSLTLKNPAGTDQICVRHCAHGRVVLSHEAFMVQIIAAKGHCDHLFKFQ